MQEKLYWEKRLFEKHCSKTDPMHCCFLPGRNDTSFLSGEKKKSNCSRQLLVYSSTLSDLSSHAIGGRIFLNMLSVTE